MNSRVHPKYKTKYRVSNWPEYERSVVQSGRNWGPCDGGAESQNEQAAGRAR